MNETCGCSSAYVKWPQINITIKILAYGKTMCAIQLILSINFQLVSVNKIVLIHLTNFNMKGVCVCEGRQVCLRDVCVLYVFLPVFVRQTKQEVEKEQNICARERGWSRER